VERTEAVTKERSAEASTHEAESESGTASKRTESAMAATSAIEFGFERARRTGRIEAGAELIEARRRGRIRRGHRDGELTRWRVRIATRGNKDCDGATCCDDELFHRKRPVFWVQRQDT
jgi:hypothetical protein